MAKLGFLQMKEGGDRERRRELGENKRRRRSFSLLEVVRRHGF